MKTRAKHVRLSRKNYVGLGAYFVTICCDRKDRLLTGTNVGEWIVSILVTIATKQSFEVAAYCAMPNHLHVLVLGKSVDSDLVKFISSFKQRTGFEYQKRAGRRLWQPKYFEHIVRSAEDLEAVALYIWNNPVRAGVCKTAVEYPLSGSMTMDWKKRYRNLGEWAPPWKQ